MAEAIVSLLVERLVDLLAHEAVLFQGVNEQVGRLVAELERMKSALEEADDRQEQGKFSRTVEKQIRELAYDAEDVIDTYILQVAHQNRFMAMLSKPSHLHTIGEQVRAIQAKLEDISKSLPAYKLISGKGESSNSNSRQRLVRRTNSLAMEEFVVSLEGITRQVLAHLMREEDSLRVVSIVGMGGIGKTTLANKLYHHVDVTRHFDYCAWVFISQQCMIREVFHEILVKFLSPPNEFRERMKNMTENELTRRLRDVLQEKRYLIVLDDIWSRDQWNILKDAFPHGKKGSKILFTTRIKDVPLAADPLSSPIELPFLTDGESWELFSRKAFLGDGIESSHSFPNEEFEKLGKDMVGKCGGLPLAIVVLGGLLATKRSLAEWEMVQRRFNADLNKYGAVNGILVLSYHDLPPHLKPCFLYLGHYPEDWEISKKELIRLWIAEGFISPTPPESGELLMEDEAEQCLQELINRCLVQVERKDRTGSGIKTCRMHDLLRDLCVEKAREENFLGIIQPPPNVNNGPHFRVNLAESQERRIAIHPSKRRVSLEGKHPNLRSLLLFQNQGFQDEGMTEVKISKCNNFRLLRVLNLVMRNVLKWRVSSEIGNLHHLRYLRLACLGDITMPGSICKLKSLHTLHIKCDGLTITPRILFRLERLRHFAVGDDFSCIDFRGVNIYLPPSDTLKNIETLKHIKVGKNFIRNINAMLSLTNVQSLGLILLRSTYVEPIVKSLIELHRLRSLHMDFSDDPGTIPNLEPLSDCRRLTKLFLGGRIQEQDGPHSSHPVLKFLPENITKLTLENSMMSVDPMAELGKLQHLRILRLSNLFALPMGFLSLIILRYLL
ncbi:Disease resistance protein [Corchorus olitorius]|uniref:Disease resistance protein n=1 Tax=Corchorus olitorius TaxID=93759 RepID=A0A1R3HMV7_9ROSI|nr:Disease resistance protein [Corchorus olitorius]